MPADCWAEKFPLRVSSGAAVTQAGGKQTKKNMRNTLQNVGGLVARVGNKTKAALAATAVMAISTVGASAQATNEGITQVQSAIEGLQDLLPGIVGAAIVVCLIGIGAVVAINLGKRLIGK